MDKSRDSIEKQEEYNNEPVFYCNSCLSLNIQSVEELDYCVDCGGTVIEQDHIDYWNEKYKSRYGEEFLKIKK